MSDYPLRDKERKYLIVGVCDFDSDLTLFNETIFLNLFEIVSISKYVKNDSFKRSLFLNTNHTKQNKACINKYLHTFNILNFVTYL